MTNDSFATATVLSGDAGSVHYDATNASGMAWFMPPMTPGRFYTFTCDEPNYTMELYTGVGPMWSGLNYLVNSHGGDGTSLKFTAKAGINYSVVVYPNPGASNNLSWTSVVHAPGWSEWMYDIQPATVSSIATLVASSGTVSTLPSSGAVQGEVSWATSNITHELAFQNRNGVICTPSPTWSTLVAWSPWEIGRLVEGVDYMLRPDRVATDNDAYIEHEPGGVNAITGWVIPQTNYAWSNPYLSAPNTAAGSSLQVEVFYNLAAQTPGGAGIMPAPGSGVTLGSITASVSGSYPKYDPGPVSSVSLFPYDPNYASPPLDAEYGVDGKMWWGSHPQAVVTLPRFRYWIPGVVPLYPLRQVQRDDGLGRSTMRARSTHSVQKSLRQRGYR